MYESEPGWLRWGSECTTPETTEDPGPQPCETVSWTTCLPAVSQEQVTWSNTITLVLTPEVDPTSVNHGFLACSEFAWTSSCLPALNGWLCTSIDFFSFDFLFTFVKLSSEVKVFVMVFSYVFYFVSSSFYSPPYTLVLLLLAPPLSPL